MLLEIIIFGFLIYIIKYKHDQSTKRLELIDTKKSEITALERSLRQVTDESTSKDRKVNESEARLIAVSSQIQSLRATAEEAEAKIENEKKRSSTQEKQILELKKEHKKHTLILEKHKNLELLETEVKKLKIVIQDSTELLKSLTDDISSAENRLLTREMEIGVFHYPYKFEHITKYREALLLIELRQKEIIKAGEDFFCRDSELARSPIIKSLKNISMKFINAEITNMIDKATPENFNSLSDRIETLFNDCRKNLASFNCDIGKEYFECALKKLELSVEYEEEKYKIRQEQQEIKRMLKEEEDSRLEAEELEEKAKEEEAKFNKMLEEAKKKHEESSDEEKKKLESYIKDLEAKVLAAHETTVRATSLAQITREGYVYIISNIGSFGENVFKIGLTRRENPLDRVKELGGASVPFLFDVHALIKCEDAPKLEHDIHKALEKNKMNKVNNRKEFFKATIDEILHSCKELGHTVKLTKLAQATEYRQTLEMNETSTLKKAS